MKKTRRKRHAAPPGFTRLVFVCDPEGQVSFWQDPVSAKLASKSQRLQRYFAADDAETVKAAIRDAVKHGHSHFSAGVRIGARRTAFCEFHMEYLRRGSRHQLLGFTRAAAGIRTEPDQLLQASEERLRLITTVVSDVMWDLDLVSGQSWHSEGAAAVFGYPDDTTLSVANWWLDHIHPDDRSRVERSYRDYLKSGQGLWEQDYRMLRADGTYAYVQDRGRAFHDAKGRVVRMVGAMVDVTSRVKAEEELKLASQALAHTGEGVLVLDAEMRIVSVNQAYAQMTGLGEVELVGKVPYSLRDGVMETSLHRDMLHAAGTVGYWRGETRNRRADGSGFAELVSLSAVRDAAGNLNHYVAVCTDLTRLRAYEDRMAFLASHDNLSGLPNRFMLMRRLNQAMSQLGEEGKLAALLYVDLDNFKLVNETFSTAMGDEALRSIASRLQETVTGWGEIFHLGSDGFAVLLSRLTQASDTRDMAAAVLAAVEKPLQVDGHNLFLSASVGVATAPPDRDAQALLRHAEAAMTLARRRGSGNAEEYAGAETDSDRSLLLVSGLRRAMEHGELYLHYQPYFDLNTGRVSGVEALLRWQHPDLGLIAPARFIPVAEETGHIARLGGWVLRGACEQMRAWQQAGLSDMHMAVNISARELRQPDFVDRLVQILEETRLLPGSLVLEFTESSMMENPDRTREVIARLHDLGVGIAIDDFGTGYSSLNYLRHYRVDYLKVDRAFVSNLPHDEHQQAIIRAIIAMAKSLGIQVIAEGVETEAQWEFLKTLDCEQGQGFLFARPESAARVEELLRNGIALFQVPN